MSVWFTLAMLTVCIPAARGCPRDCTCESGSSIIKCIDLGYYPSFSPKVRFNATKIIFVNCTLQNFHMHRTYWPKLSNLTMITSTANCIWVNYTRKWIKHVHTDCAPPLNCTLDNTTLKNTSDSHVTPVVCVRQNNNNTSSDTISTFQRVLLMLINIQSAILFTIVVTLSVRYYKNHSATLHRPKQKQTSDQCNHCVTASLHITDTQV